MRILRSLSPIGCRCRLVVACALMAAYLLAAAGGPTALGPQPVALSTVAYPCAAHRCGCTDAAACWQHCCCFSLEQRLAWARATESNHPPWAGRIATSTTRRRSTGCGIVSARVSEDDEADHGAHAAAACADHANCRGPRCCEVQAGLGRPARRVPARGWQSVRCAGITTLWVTLGVTVPPLAAQTAQGDLTACGWVAVDDPGADFAEPIPTARTALPRLVSRCGPRPRGRTKSVPPHTHRAGAALASTPITVRRPPGPHSRAARVVAAPVPGFAQAAAGVPFGVRRGAHVRLRSARSSSQRTRVADVGASECHIAAGRNPLLPPRR